MKHESSSSNKSCARNARIPVVSEVDTVWIQHGNDLERDVLAQQLGHRMRADQELDEALAHVGRWSFTWMNTGCNYDDLARLVARRVGRLLELRVPNGQQVQATLLLKVVTRKIHVALTLT